MIARCSTEHGSGLGTQRWAVERSFAHLHNFRRLRIRYERREEIRAALLLLACSILCFRPLPSLCETFNASGPGTSKGIGGDPHEPPSIRGFAERLDAPCPLSPPRRCSRLLQTQQKSRLSARGAMDCHISRICGIVSHTVRGNGR